MGFGFMVLLEFLDRLRVLRIYGHFGSALAVAATKAESPELRPADSEWQGLSRNLLYVDSSLELRKGTTGITENTREKE
jgi:hypothetical protein